jgi:biotin synthase
VAHAFASLEKKKLSYCASLGIIHDRDFNVLKKAGVTRYHHNLETAESHFKKICTTHTFKDRVDTINRAQKVGFEICSGGIFGIGETDIQVLELALELKRLDIDAVPLNFLSPILGTPMEGFSSLTPLKCLKIIALFRYVLPEKDIFICGGRQLNLKQLEPYIFHAGASGIMTGNYLTTQGARLDDDLEMIAQLGFEALI